MGRLFKYISFSIFALLLILPIVPTNLLHVVEAQPAPKYKWTFMVYLDADNNLERYGIDDFNEMEMAGSTDEVAIVVIMDRHPGYDTSNGNWTTTRIYLVLHDEDPAIINSQLLVDLGELNMGDPKNLVFFVNWTITRFPAERYALVLWDHGNAWRTREGGGEEKGVCWDETDGNDYITEEELRWAFEEISKLGVRMNLVSFDVCYLGMVEVAYDLIPYVDVMVASQETEPGPGQYYTPSLQKLIANPNMTPHELGKEIVEAYRIYYTQIVRLSYPTLAAVDLKVFNASVVPNIDRVARTLYNAVRANLNLSYVIKELRDASDKTGSNGEFIDLYDFLERIVGTGAIWGANDPRSAANTTIYYLNQSIIAFWAGPGHPRAHGLGIYLPPTVDLYLRERFWYNMQTLFPTRTYWGRFLDYYFRAFAPSEVFTVAVQAPTIINAGEDGYAFIRVLYGTRGVNPDTLTIRLYKPTGESVTLPSKRIANGLYVVSIPSSDMTTLLITVDAGYWILSYTTSTVVQIAENMNERLKEVSVSLAKDIADVKKALDEKTASLAKDIANVKSTVDERTTSLAKDIADVKSTVNERTASVINTVETSKNLIKSLIENNVSSSIASIGALLTERTDLLLNLLSSINTVVLGIEKSVSDVNVVLKRVGSLLEGAVSTLGTISSTLETLNTGIEEVKATLSTISSSLGQISTVVSTIKANVDSLVSAINEISGTLTQVLDKQAEILDKQGLLISIGYAAIALLIISIVILALSVVILSRRK